MKQAMVTIKYEEEKLNAIKQYMGKKDADFEAEMNEVLGKMYEKYVPQAVREYIESRGDVPLAIKKSNKSSVRNIAPSAGLGNRMSKCRGERANGKYNPSAEN